MTLERRSRTWIRKVRTAGRKVTKGRQNDKKHWTKGSEDKR
jgi:hypothetical protein